MTTSPGPLDGIRIFDLSRILAGPTCTQYLADLGADVIKIERPGVGDDTRKWGPPYLKDQDGKESNESAYYLCANRNKRSVAIDVSKPEGQALARRMIAKCDVLTENYKTGGLAKYGLGYDQLKDEFPGLVYCSITGFGQTGPYAERAGYDFLAQGMGGIMSLTGEIDGDPMKVGVGIADIMCGMYASTAILAALRHRDRTGEGQHIDLSLLETQLAWLTNEGMNYLISGEAPKRRGNAHPNIVPYEVFPTSDGYFILACGNDRQFQSLCDLAERPEIAADERFSTNPARIRNRETLIPLLRQIFVSRNTAFWLDGLEKRKVPAAPVNDLPGAFADPHLMARGMVTEIQHEGLGVTYPVISNPVKMSRTPPTYRRGAPLLGQHTEEVIRELLGADEEELAKLRNSAAI
ncbi:CoA transferase [Alphaproteobacteria bacterium HT1-32]|nr:CoA transferase [Alphaproteobacteria bacterium HT1-32]